MTANEKGKDGRRRVGHLINQEEVYMEDLLTAIMQTGLVFFVLFIAAAEIDARTTGEAPEWLILPITLAGIVGLVVAFFAMLALIWI